MTTSIFKNTIKIALLSTILALPLVAVPELALAKHHENGEQHKSHQEMHEGMQHGEHHVFDMKNPRHAVERLLTGGQPSKSDFEHLRDNGYTTIINMRGEGEFDGFNEPELVEEMGMSYISIPIASSDDMSMENILKLDSALKAADGRVLLHCGSGNRAGAMIALKAFRLEGMSEDEAMALGIAAGMTSLEPTVRELIQTAE